MPTQLKLEDLDVINAQCCKCKAAIEGKLPSISKAYLCPYCGGKNETIDSETLHTARVYNACIKDISKVPMLKPAKPSTKDMKVRCHHCKNVFQANQVYDGQIRICPKCGASTKFVHLKQMCFACMGIIDAIVPNTVQVLRCPSCGSYEVPY